ncbi:MAG: VTT domain-containing protein [Magnetococcus sp. XQGC-1]
MIWRGAVALGLLAGAILAYHYRGLLEPAQWLEGWGALGMVIFVLLYILATVLFLPGSVLTLAGGALFGPWLGGLLSLAGATLGAGIAFLLARHLAGEWVARRAAGMLARLLEGVEREGWRFVAFVRLVPVFPFNLLNYALGLTRIRFTHYLLASLLCMAPGGLAYAWLGHAGKEAVSGSAEAVHAGLWAMGLLSVAFFLPRWIAQLRNGKRQLSTAQLRKMLADGEDLLLLDVRDAVDFSGESGHIPGSRNIPLPELESRLPELRALDCPIMLICHTERRSGEAMRRLDGAGIGPLFLVRGGIKRWREENFPLER